MFAEPQENDYNRSALISPVICQGANRVIKDTEINDRTYRGYVEGSYEMDNGIVELTPIAQGREDFFMIVKFRNKNTS